MSKRQAETEPGGAEPPAKKIVFEPLQLGAISNLEELDLKTLQFQNRKLGQRLALKNKCEEELRGRYVLVACNLGGDYEGKFAGLTSWRKDRPRMTLLLMSLTDTGTS